MKTEWNGGKKSKHRVTIAFFVNGAGVSESLPIMIWKSKNPCFKGVKKEHLPVRYYSQPKLWMTGDILHDVLAPLNRKLKSKGQCWMSPIGLSREIEQHPDSVSATKHHIKASTLILGNNPEFSTEVVLPEVADRG